MTDQQPTSCLAAYGQNRVIRTPRLDSLAGNSLLFERAYISAFPCALSRSCLLTGREMNELYDLNIDPHEMKNLAGDIQSSETVSVMKEKIFTWLEGTGHPYRSTIKKKDLEKSV